MMDDGFVWYVLANLIRGEPIVNYPTEAIVVKFIKQNVTIDCVKSFFKIYEDSTWK